MNKRQAKKIINLKGHEFVRLSLISDRFGRKIQYGPYYDFPKKFDCRAFRKKLISDFPINWYKGYPNKPTALL